MQTQQIKNLPQVGRLATHAVQRRVGRPKQLGDQRRVQLNDLRQITQLHIRIVSEIDDLQSYRRQTRQIAAETQSLLQFSVHGVST